MRTSGLVTHIASKAQPAQALRAQPRPRRRPGSQASQRIVMRIIQLPGATRARRLRRCTTILLRSCIRGIRQSEITARTWGWAMRSVWEFRECE